MSFYDEASWVLIPEGIKEDVVYAQKPTDGLGDLTFTRASDATRTNSAGEIERTPWNLATFSEMFSDASWVKLGTTITPNTTTAPNGTLTADTMSIADSNSRIAQAVTLGAGTYTFSAYVKILSQTTAGTMRLQAVVDGSNVSTVFTATTEWQRVIGTFTAATGITSIVIRGQAFVGDIAVWGVQFVQGTDAKPYFATTNRQDVPRLDYRNADGSLNSCPRLLLEPQRTNSVRNSTMVGAVAGSPGTLPTNWSVIGGAGLTQTIVGTGTESGLTYLDVRYNGTATSTDVIRLTQETNTGIAASNGQTWSLSPYVKVTIASGATPSYSLRMAERTAVGSLITVGTQSATFTSTLTRQTYTRTLIGGVTVGAVVPEIGITVTNGAAYDFTIRIAAPQMELGAYATTFIPTTTAAVTRIADDASKLGVSSLIGQTQGTLFFEYSMSNWETPSRLFGVSDGSSTNRIVVILNTNQRFRFLVNVGSVAQVDFSTNSFTNGVFKIAFAYAENDFAVYINGVQVGTDNSGTIPACSNIYVGKVETIAAVNHIGNALSQAALFPTRLTNAQLAQLTT
jgi:hypothetical protein